MHPEKNPLEQQERTNNKLNPHRDLNPGDIDGRQVLSPLHHPCSPLCRLRVTDVNQKSGKSSLGEKRNLEIQIC